MDLPEFDQLTLMARNNPEEFDALLQRHNRYLIDTAPKEQKRRLEGLLFKINMERRRSKNAMQNCINISRLMMDSLVDLQTSLETVRHFSPHEEALPVIHNDNVHYLQARD